MIIKCQWSDENKTLIRAELDDGTIVSIPVTLGNRHYEEILRLKLPIADYVALKADRIEEIKAELRVIDQASIRALRAINKTGNGVAEDIAVLDDLESQAEALRAELAGLLG